MENQPTNQLPINIGKENRGRLVIEAVEERERIIKSIHDGNHFGVNRTRDMITSKYYWPGMSKEIQSYVSSMQWLAFYISKLGELHRPGSLASQPVFFQSLLNLCLDSQGASHKTKHLKYASSRTYPNEFCYVDIIHTC